jgi:hypothetical protein
MTIKMPEGPSNSQYGRIPNAPDAKTPPDDSADKSTPTISPMNKPYEMGGKPPMKSNLSGKMS